MDWLATILTSPNALLVICGVIVLLVLVAHFSKKGLFSLNLKGIKVGAADKERTLFRQQMEFIKARTDIMVVNLIDLFDDADEWRIRYICKLIEDVWQMAIVYNHITNDQFYTESKFEKIWAIVLSETTEHRFKDEKFKGIVRKECEDIINHLVEIKKYFS